VSVVRRTLGAKALSARVSAGSETERITGTGTARLVFQSADAGAAGELPAAAVEPPAKSSSMPIFSHES
jgi:hypothetical protein